MKYSIIIPTMWFNNSYLKNMVVKYGHSPFIEEILIVNNRNADKKGIDLLPKVRLINNGKNLYVNPSWNLGAKEAKAEGLIFANDDIFIIHPEMLLEQLSNTLQKGEIIGMHDTCFSELSDYDLRIVPTFKQRNEGFGTFMAIHKETFKEIPPQFKVWYGDDILFMKNRPKVIKGCPIISEMRGTSKRIDLHKIRQSDKIAYDAYIKENKEEECVNVVLVYKEGKDFSYNDVFILTSKLRKTYQGILPLNVYCITDMVKEEESVMGLTLLPMEHIWPGWWSKMNLFSPNLASLRPFVFFDLDTAILKDIRGLQFLNYPKHFIMLSDFYRPQRPASGVMYFPKQHPKINKVWSTWIKNPEEWMKKYRGDQEFISSQVTPDLRWQDITKAIGTFKPKNGRLWLDNPFDLSVVCFHGKPKIPEAAETVPWVEKYLYGK